MKNVKSSDCGKSGRPEKQSPVVAAKGSQAVSLNLRERPQISGVADFTPPPNFVRYLSVKDIQR